jgi:hypothetical protein
MKLPRFSVRTLLVLVALIGIVLNAVVLLKRRGIYLSQASTWRGTEQHYHDNILRIQKVILELEELIATQKANGEDMTRHEELLRFYAGCLITARSGANAAATSKRRYERAARFPWLGVPPAPPEPK